MTRKRKFNDFTSLREKRGFNTYFLKLERRVWILFMAIMSFQSSFGWVCHRMTIEIMIESGIHG